MQAYRFWEGALISPGQAPERVAAGQVTHGFFSLFGVEPYLGRTFLAEEDRPGGEKTLILSHAFWQQHFGGDPKILDKLLDLDGASYKVVGVLPASFVSPAGRGEVCWMPLQAKPDTRRMVHTVRTFARLRTGTSAARSEREMKTLMSALEKEYPTSNEGRSAQVIPLFEEVVGKARTTLLTLWAVVGTVLLIACVNITNLLLARALRNRREVAVRASLGSSRGRIIGKVVAEVLFLAALGGVLGLALAYGLIRLVVALGPDHVPRLAGVGIDSTVLVFSLVMTIVVGLICALWPAFQVSALDVQRGLSSGGSRAGSGGFGQARLRRLLVIFEVALAMVLVIGAGLLIKSFYRLLNVDLGFKPHHLLTVELTLPSNTYPFPPFTEFPKWPKFDALYRGLNEQLSATPGIEAFALTGSHPLNSGWTTQITLDKLQQSRPNETEEIRIRAVSPTYFSTAGVKLLRGRPTTARDVADSPPVVIVNDSFAHRFFNGNAIGQRITFWNKSREIIGVVANERFMGIGQEVPPAMYPPLLQAPMTFFNIVVRTHSEPESAVPAIQRAVWANDPNLAVYSISSLEALADKSVAQPRFNMQLVLLFAIAALLLAAVGIYGLMAHAVEQRTQEIGVRLALGGQRADIMWMVLSEAGRLIALGLAFGLLLSLAGTRLMSSLLFNVSSVDPGVFIAVALVLAASGLLACLVPLIIATRVDPVVALKYE